MEGSAKSRHHRISAIHLNGQKQSCSINLASKYYILRYEKKYLLSNKRDIHILVLAQ
jgi:hypothetical protein